MKIKLKTDVDNAGTLYLAGLEFDNDNTPFNLDTLEWLASVGAIEKIDIGYAPVQTVTENSKPKFRRK